MRFTRRSTLVLAVVSAVVCACGNGAEDDAVTRPAVVGLWPNVHERTVSPDGLCGYLRTFDDQMAQYRTRVAEANVDTLTIAVFWSSVDAGNGTTPDFSRAGLLGGAIEDGYDLYLAFTPIFTARYTTPSDLGDAPFSTVPATPGGPVPLDRTIERGRTLLDEMVEQVPGVREHIAYLSLGNEVDAFALLNPESTTFTWQSFVRYVEEVGAHARARLPQTKITVTVTSRTALSPDGFFAIMALRPFTDVLAINHYVGGAAEDEPAATLERVLALYPSDWPIVVQELGFIGAADAHGDQVDFVDRTFRFAAANGARMPYLTYFSLHDWHVEPEPCEALGAPSPCNPCDSGCRWCGAGNASVFDRLLATVGLLESDGAPKPAWERFRANACALRNGSTDDCRR